MQDAPHDNFITQTQGSARIATLNRLISTCERPADTHTETLRESHTKTNTQKHPCNVLLAACIALVALWSLR